MARAGGNLKWFGILWGLGMREIYVCVCEILDFVNHRPIFFVQVPLQSLRKFQGVPARFGYCSCMGRFERFRFSFLTVPLWKGFFCFNTVLTEGTVPVPVSVPEKWFRRFQFLFRFLENGSDSSGLVPGPSRNFRANEKVIRAKVRTRVRTRFGTASRFFLSARSAPLKLRPRHFLEHPFLLSRWLPVMQASHYHICEDERQR